MIAAIALILVLLHIGPGHDLQEVNSAREDCEANGGKYMTVQRHVDPGTSTVKMFSNRLPDGTEIRYFMASTSIGRECVTTPKKENPL